MSSVSPGALVDDLGEVLADPVVRHAAVDGDARLRHVGELDRVVRVRPDRVGEVLADLVRGHVERGRELDVADVVAAEVHVHQAGHELVVRRVLVVLHALEQRVGAVADADDRDADLVLAARATVGGAVGRSHGVLSIGGEGDVERLGEREEHEVVHVAGRAAARRTSARGGAPAACAARRCRLRRGSPCGGGRSGGRGRRSAPRGVRRRRRSGSTRGGRPRARPPA